MRPRLVRLAAAVLATAAAGLGVVGAAAPAGASACSGASGVTVVVDHGALGGGVDLVCSDSSGGNAAALFSGAGFSLSYVQRQPGFVCRINGQPASDPCVNTPPSDAYWALWWSDGKSGAWSYSSLGAGSLSVPEGGYVGFAWQSGAKRAPGVSPVPHGTAPTPTAAPSSTPSSGGGPSSTAPTKKPPTKPAGQPSTHSSSPSSRPSTKPSATSASTPTAPASDPSESTSASAPASASASGSLAPGTDLPDETNDSATAATSETVPPTAPTELSGTEGASAPPSAASSEAADPGASNGSQALPVWVVPLVLVLLAGGGAAYGLRRRNRTGP